MHHDSLVRIAIFEMSAQTIATFSVMPARLYRPAKYIRTVHRVFAIVQ